jgi:hypothetical protein
MRFEGSRFYPASAAVCIFATTSAWISAACGLVPLPPLLGKGLELIVAAFFIAALVFSTIGAFSLTISGEDGVGTLIVRGRPVPAPLLWTAYLLSFLVPWLGLIPALLWV